VPWATVVTSVVLSARDSARNGRPTAARFFGGSSADDGISVGLFEVK
jgi:hypothetical protein